MQTYCVACHDVYGIGAHRTYGHALATGMFASHGETQLAPDNNQEHNNPSPSAKDGTFYVWLLVSTSTHFLSCSVLMYVLPFFRTS